MEKVAPVFNKYGYSGTSMADLTRVTGLTKGAIYGNFENKEELAVKAFNYNIRLVMGKLTAEVDQFTSPVDRLRAILDFYRKYYDMTISFGGCPVINVGVDANYQNPMMLERVKQVIGKLKGAIRLIIEEGMQAGEFRRDLDADRYAGRFFAAIEGSIFLSATLETGEPMVDMMNHLETMMNREMLV